MPLTCRRSLRQTKKCLRPAPQRSVFVSVGENGPGARNQLEPHRNHARDSFERRDTGSNKNGADGGTRTRTGIPPTDFLTDYGFHRRRPDCRSKRHRLWSGLSLHHSQRADLRCCPSSLYTFRAFARLGSGLASVRSGPLAFPEFEQFYARHFHRGTQSHGLSLLCLPIPPRPLARLSDCIGSQLAPNWLPVFCLCKFFILLSAPQPPVLVSFFPLDPVQT